MPLSWSLYMPHKLSRQDLHARDVAVDASAHLDNNTQVMFQLSLWCCKQVKKVLGLETSSSIQCTLTAELEMQSAGMTWASVLVQASAGGFGEGTGAGY